MYLQLKDIEEYLYASRRLELNSYELDIVEQSYRFLATFANDKVIYGINTGFGPMAQYRIDEDKLNQLQYNIIRSHATGVGQHLPFDCVKAAMIARLCTFMQAKSGVHTDAILLLQAFINNDIIPFIPQHGSVGASGDLVQLAHLALTLIGEGEVFYKGELLPTSAVMAKEGLTPLKMYLREGLALCNGTAVMTGVGLVNLIHAKRLLKQATALSVMVNEIVGSYSDFMDETLNTLKNHKGQNDIAHDMRMMSQGSKLLKNRTLLYCKHTEEVFQYKVQPYYSLRCVPQILGPIAETIDNVEKVLIEELNAVDDNPIVDMESKMVYHGGNFHGDYVSFEMDKLKIAITKLTMLMERQLNYLFHDKINELLPPFLNLGVLGLNYGLQAAQFTATSTTAECQTLSNPMYIHSIPNNNDNQDIVSMGTNAALIAQRIIDNAYQVMAVHCMAVAQAVDCLKIADKLAPHTHKLYDDIRTLVPVFVNDKPKYKELEQVIDYLKRD